MGKTNLVYICNYAANYTGNFIASLIRIAEAEMRNRRVFFVFPEDAKEKKWLKNLPIGCEVLFCKFDKKSLGVFSKKLARELGRSNTIVHTHFVDGFSQMAIKMRFKHIISHYHMCVPEIINMRRRIRRILDNIFYANCILVGVSDAVMADLKKYLKFSKCLCIPNAIDFDSLEKCSTICSSAGKISDGMGFKILMHGTHFFRKGVDMAIQAIENLHMRGYECCLYITSHNVEEAKANVQKIANKKELFRVIEVVEDVKNLYDNVDLFISPSRSEAFGYAVAEASYSNCQVAASMTDGQNCMMDIPGIIWHKPADAEALQDAIIEAIENKLRGIDCQIKEEQRTFTLKNYNVDQWVESVAQLYKICEKNSEMSH